VGNIKEVGRIYRQTFIDTCAKVALCRLYDRKNALVAADRASRRGSASAGAPELARVTNP